MREYYLHDDAYQTVQQALLAKPEAGALIPGTGGLRKLRWPDFRRGKGRRGGLRIVYLYLPRDSEIWLFTLYGKDEADDLTPEQRRTFKRAIKAELEARRRRQ